QNLEGNFRGRRAEVIIDGDAPGRIVRLGLLRREGRPGVFVGTDADGLRWHVEKRVRRAGGADLAQRRSVVQYPEPAAERGNYQVVAMHHQVAYRAGRHVQLERLPVAAVIQGERHVALGGGVEQAAAHGIFADAVEVGGLGEAIYGERPRLSVIARAVQVRQGA